MKIVLADGTTLNDIVLNGSNYISKNKIEANVFHGNCSPVVIHDGDSVETHDYMTLVQLEIRDDEYWFVLRDLSIDELEKLKIQSDIAYIAMMQGIEL